VNDRIPGGKAAGRKPSDFDREQLRLGTRHEMEHTRDRTKAREIAMDHLAEDPSYYTHLSEMESRVEEQRLRNALGRDA